MLLLPKLDFYLRKNKMQNPGEHIVRTSDIVEDRTFASNEIEVQSLEDEASQIYRGIVAAEALDNLILYILRIGDSNRVG